MIKLIQILIEGALVGLVYGLVAISFVVIYRASRIVNLAQGEVLVIGALLLWTFTAGMKAAGWEVPLIISLAMTLAACIAFGLILERFVFRPLISQPAFAIFMASVALLIMLRGTAQLLWTAETRAFPVILPEGAFQLGPFLISTPLALGGLFSVLLAIGLHAFFTRTRQGLRLAAVAEDHRTAMSLGVSVRSAIATAWILGTVVATAAAIVLLSGRVVSLEVAHIGFKALPVALLGGLESIRGAPLAGILIGVGEALAMAYLDPLTNGAASGLLPYLVMITVLLVQPQGLFGWKRIERL
ncbi:MAG: branched-chain amino acid ABC transporter permease [Methylobacterium sp.]|jgi:branched-chain amino acid transport system permease protein|nr:branched-chain amino acid ABC transporter permease [Cupriavidus sp.]MCA3513146.1 branched-chain amino acid ABC transporter permease [Rhodobacter sp.]MCA3635003.1 branched-chain amino acid ABC transporter permease [Methylobacterium sp.]MCE2932353.1 branched-chain amino acid ABC transporter permease [Hyphomicrobiales bacterium]MCA3639528.1 branched-chain amino acid ABC transporter permease [Methylobacterium sp.]